MGGDLFGEIQHLNRLDHYTSLWSVPEDGLFSSISCGSRCKLTKRHPPQTGGLELARQVLGHESLPMLLR